MLFKVAIAVIASSQLPAAYGNGFIRRATADNSNVETSSKFGKADKDALIKKEEEEPLGLEDFSPEFIEANPPTELTPEPRFFNFKAAEQWNHGATAVTSANSGTVKFYAPTDTQVGDTLFLFLSRTDGLLPLEIEQWKRAAACFKSTNKQDSCMRADHCVKRDGPYCLQFDQEAGGGNGRDLGTVVFYHHVTADDPGCWTVELPGKSAVWAIVTAISDVNRDRPIFRKKGVSCDVSRCSHQMSILVLSPHLFRFNPFFRPNGRVNSPQSTGKCRSRSTHLHFHRVRHLTNLSP